MVLTGLRKGERARLTVGQVYLDNQTPHVELLTKDEKAGRGARVPLWGDLAADLEDWLGEKLAAFQEMARLTEKPVSLCLPAGEPLFTVPQDFVKILDRDLAAAGIPKRDDRGRTVDLHALRHTFGTHFSKNGVTSRTGQAAMRHSSLDLTLNVYTDPPLPAHAGLRRASPSLLDVAGAMEALPSLSLVIAEQLEDDAATACPPAYAPSERVSPFIG
jgi:integrase